LHEGRLLSFSKNHFNWSTIVEIPYEQAVSSIARTKSTVLKYVGLTYRTMIIVGFIVFFNILIASMYVGYRVTKKVREPLILLINATRKIAAGNLALRVNIKTKDEIGFLARSFNKMAVDLNNALIAKEREMSERTKTEDELEKAVVETERATNIKTLFMANISHDIRTPLNSILGAAVTFNNTDLDAEQRQLMNTMNSNTETLLGTVNDILDLEKIEAGEVILESKEFNISELVQKVVTSLSFAASSKGLKIEFMIDSDVPKVVTGVSFRLRQVLQNLIGNSIKFTEKGVITIEVHAEDRYEFGIVGVKFIVQDTGIGIALDQQKTIFDSFIQAEQPDSKKYGGAGLGLAISKRLVELMGGELFVDSLPGKGSEFYFIIPCMPASIPENKSFEGDVVKEVADAKSITEDSSGSATEPELKAKETVV